METTKTTSDLKRKDIARNYRILVTELDIRAPIVNPMKCMPKLLADKLSMSEKVKCQALIMMEELVNKRITAEKGPWVLRGGAICIFHKK